MLRLADNDDPLSRLGCTLDNAVDARHTRAGRVDDKAALGRKLLTLPTGDSVRAYHDPRTVRQLRHTLRDAKPLGGQAAHRVRVMDELTEAPAAISLVKLRLRERHGSFHADAKAGALRNVNLHRPSPVQK